ncbi:MAG TPA: hypothetical protein VJA47_05480 [archaeon]|nr:hypothetical protein [archaeon]
MVVQIKIIAVLVVVIVAVVAGVLVSLDPQSPPIDTFSPTTGDQGPLAQKAPIPDGTQAILGFIGETDDRAQKFEALNKLKTTVPPLELAVILTTMLSDPDPEIRSNIVQTFGDDPIINSALSTNIQNFVNGDHNTLAGIVSVIQDWPSDGSAVTLASPPCNQNDFSCLEWSACQGGKQGRMCNKINQACQGDPILTQSCIDSCSPDWSCSNWSAECADSKQSRTCTDNNNCGIDQGKPNETQSCTSEDQRPQEPNCPPDNHPIYKLIESSSVDIKIRCSLYVSLGACISKIKSRPDCGQGPGDDDFLINNWPIVGDGGDPAVEIIEPEDGYSSEEKTDVDLKVKIDNLILQPPGGLIGAKSIQGKLFKEGHLKIYLDGKEIYTGKNKGGLTTSHTLTVPILGLEPWPDGSAREYLIRAEVHENNHFFMVPRVFDEITVKIGKTKTNAFMLTALSWKERDLDCWALSRATGLNYRSWGTLSIESCSLSIEDKNIEKIRTIDDVTIKTTGEVNLEFDENGKSQYGKTLSDIFNDRVFGYDATKVSSISSPGDEGVSKLFEYDMSAGSAYDIPTFEVASVFRKGHCLFTVTSRSEENGYSGKYHAKIGPPPKFEVIKLEHGFDHGKSDIQSENSRFAGTMMSLLASPCEIKKPEERKITVKTGQPTELAINFQGEVQSATINIGGQSTKLEGAEYTPEQLYAAGLGYTGKFGAPFGLGKIKVYKFQLTGPGDSKPPEGFGYISADPIKLGPDTKAEINIERIPGEYENRVGDKLFLDGGLVGFGSWAMKTEENSDRSPRTEKIKVEINPVPKTPQEPSSAQKADIDGAVNAELDSDKNIDEKISGLLKEMEELAQKARNGQIKPQEAGAEIDKKALLVIQEGQKRSANPTATLLFIVSPEGQEPVLQKYFSLPRPYSEISGYSDKVEKALESIATILANGADPDSIATKIIINPETTKRIVSKVKK